MASWLEKIPPLCDENAQANPELSRSLLALGVSLQQSSREEGGARSATGLLRSDTESPRGAQTITLCPARSACCSVFTRSRSESRADGPTPSRTRATSAGGKREGGGDHGRGRRGSVRSGGERAGFTARGPSCGAGKVWRVGGPSTATPRAAPTHAEVPPRRATAAPAAGIDWQTALALPTLLFLTMEYNSRGRTKMAALTTSPQNRALGGRLMPR